MKARRFPTKEHDYDPSWDYEVVKASSEVRKLSNASKKEIKTYVLAKIEGTIFRNFQIHFVKGTGRLGKFVDGTASEPVILLDEQELRGASKKYGVDLATAIESTMMHEIGHALQEVNGLPKSEEQAERFAKEYWETGSVMQFKPRQ